MARTPSTMLPLGTELPQFELQNTFGGRLNSDSLKDKPALIIFMCNHCPFVKHLLDGFDVFFTDYSDTELNIIAINSNDVVNYPDDAPPKMKELFESRAWNIPYLMDEDQELAKTFRAACTPDFYLFDGSGKLAYRGQFDGSRPGNDVPVTGNDLRAAVDAVLSGQPVSGEQLPSLGCNIKWKAGNEPDYFG